VSTSSVSSATPTTTSTTAAVTPTTSFGSDASTSSKIDGLVSGLDTTSIIAAIMAQSAEPQTNLKNQLATETAKLAAYQSINTKMATLQTAADALTSPSAWQAMATTSSDASVSATATTGAQAGLFSFNVTQLAAAQSSVFSGAVSTTSASVVSTGTPVTITNTSTGAATTISTGDGSLASVIAGINASNAGVRATAVQASAGVYKLQLTSTTTGAASAFSVAGLSSALGTVNNTTNAADAQITVGTGAAAYTVSSSSNTFSQAIPDMTFTVSQLTTGVTLTTSSDDNGIASNIQAMVDAANAVLTEISTDTSYNTTSNTGSVLTGDFTAEQLSDKILSTVSSAVGTGVSAAQFGLEVTKDGQITFDSSTFETAFAANPTGVANAFVATGSFTPAQTGLTGTVSLQKGSDGTATGVYGVVVTQAATQATSTIDTSGGITAGQTITLGGQGNTATYTTTGTETQQTLTDALNALSSKNQLGVNATVGSGGLIDLTASGYGSEYSFTSSATGGLTASAVTAGLDVTGSINGQTASGIGQILFTNYNTPGVDALSLLVTLTPADVAALAGSSAGNFTYAAGVAQGIASVANSAVDPIQGSITNEISGENSNITDLNTQIANWQVVLDTEQTGLETKWANLESQLEALKNQSSSLSAEISGGTSSSSSSSNSSSSSSSSS
jgi:flagellar hook-associated protein 2